MSDTSDKKDRRKKGSDRRESAGKMKEQYIDYFIPKEEEQRTGEDRRKK